MRTPIILLLFILAGSGIKVSCTSDPAESPAEPEPLSFEQSVRITHHQPLGIYRIEVLKGARWEHKKFPSLGPSEFDTLEAAQSQMEKYKVRWEWSAKCARDWELYEQQATERKRLRGSGEFLPVQNQKL